MLVTIPFSTLIGLAVAGCGASVQENPGSVAAVTTERTETMTAPAPQNENDGIFAVIQTRKGDIRLKLEYEKAPMTVANFVALAEGRMKNSAKPEGTPYFDGLIFHRVIPGFMIQGGGFAPGMQQKPTDAPITNEAANGLKNEVYTIAMARTNDPHSATAQFFINVTNNSFLNHTAPSGQGWGYAVFGKVVSGTEIVKKIEGVPTGRRGFHDDVPKDDVVIEKAVVVE